MAHIYLVTYRPLIESAAGRSAISTYQLPSYIDGSCRREPDFQSSFPSISAICRKGKFAPRLCEGDIAVYMTCRGDYPGFNESHWRLTAILEVYKRFPSHVQAAQWYCDEQMPLPPNCIVAGNAPLPVAMTSRRRDTVYPSLLSSYKGKRLLPLVDKQLDIWDQEYQKRAEEWGIFLACIPQFLELDTLPIITRAMLIEIFKRIPGTRTPPVISEEEFEHLKRACGIGEARRYFPTSEKC